MTIKELRERYENLKSELREFIGAGDLEKSKAKEKEVKEARELLRIAEEQEKEDRERLLNQEKTKIKEGRKITREEELRAIAAIALKRGNELTEEERSTIVSSSNSAIIPKQFVNELIEIKKGYGSLKQFCDVIPVIREEGTIPVVDYDQNELADLVEGQDIVEGNLVTTDVPFKCTKIGLFQKVSSETVDDAAVEVDNLIRTNFSEIATVKENKKILKVINDGAAKIEDATDYTAIENAIDKTVPSAKGGLVTLCNSTGYCLLNNMKDKQGRPLNLITIGADGNEYFHNKLIYEFDDSLVTLTEGKTSLFFVLNFKEAVKFIDRNKLTVSTGKEIKDDTDMWSILERIDVINGSKRTIKKIEL
ncbi:phage major capsid protein [Clostridium perfringens]|uniref:phage major capsid protein n=1 Tax=Clostridium perfringens TaxID=1502 RepID=UPI0018E4BEBF|nr:phage major capsid protein [Clostridium perfringens]MBI6052346.1 phage major capsid protein [Clostridium perfringens]